MHDSRINKFIFLIGDVIGMVVAWLHMFKDSIDVSQVSTHDFFVALWITIVFGFIGGFSTMAGRLMFGWMEEKIKGRFKNKKDDLEKN
jgi:ABC-type Fe3+ transport system permease subunit